MGRTVHTELSVRPADASDSAVVASMFAEDYAYYGLDVPELSVIKAHIDRVISSESAQSVILVGRLGDDVVGFATYAIMYPAPGPSGQLYMKELFIRDAHRGQGLGRQFLKAIARVAVDAGCSRFDWTSETTNPKAVAFYEQIGAAMLEEKRYFRIDGDALTAFANEDQ